MEDKIEIFNCLSRKQLPHFFAGSKARQDDFSLWLNQTAVQLEAMLCTSAVLCLRLGDPAL